MKYGQPIRMTREEIFKALNETDVGPSDRIGVVLSAVLYEEEVEFSGDMLIKEFSKANDEEKLYLKNVFDTFYQKNRTTYRIDESILLLEKYGDMHPEISEDIKNTINDLIDYKEIFRGR